MAVAAAALLVAGCGGTGSAKTATGVAAKQYVAQVNAAERSLVNSVQRIAPAATPPVWARSVRSMEVVVGRLGDDLASIRPPAAATGAHQRLVATVRRLAAELGAAARRGSTAAGLPSAKAQLLQAFSATSAAFTAAIGQLNAALRH